MPDTTTQYVPPIPDRSMRDAMRGERKTPRKRAATIEELWAAVMPDDPVVPFIVTSAFDPLPPDMNGVPLEPAMMLMALSQEEVKRAAEPLRKQLEESLPRVADFGYEWEDSIDPAEVRRNMLKAVK